MKCFFLTLYARLFIRDICVRHAEEKNWHYRDYRAGDYYGCSGCKEEELKRQDAKRERREAKRLAARHKLLDTLEALRKCKGE